MSLTGQVGRHLQMVTPSQYSWNLARDLNSEIWKFDPKIKFLKIFFQKIMKKMTLKSIFY